MVFRRKKRGMIDISELQKRGKINSPDFMPHDLESNKEGFVEVVNSKDISTLSKNSDSLSSSDYVNIENVNSFSTESNGYSRKEVDIKIQQLDTLIYKLEQRIELLEKKVGIDNSSSVSSSNSNNNLIGW